MDEVGDVTIITELFALLFAETVFTCVVLACFRIQSSLQYTEFSRDDFTPQTIQFVAGCEAPDDDDEDVGEAASIFLTRNGKWSEAFLRGNIF